MSQTGLRVVTGRVNNRSSVLASETMTRPSTRPREEADAAGREANSLHFFGVGRDGMRMPSAVGQIENAHAPAGVPDRPAGTVSGPVHGFEGSAGDLELAEERMAVDAPVEDRARPAGHLEATAFVVELDGPELAGRTGELRVIDLSSCQVQHGAAAFPGRDFREVSMEFQWSFNGVRARHWTLNGAFGRPRRPWNYGKRPFYDSSAVGFDRRPPCSITSWFPDPMSSGSWNKPASRTGRAHPKHSHG